MSSLLFLFFQPPGNLRQVFIYNPKNPAVIFSGFIAMSPALDNFHSRKGDFNGFHRSVFNLRREDQRIFLFIILIGKYAVVEHVALLEKILHTVKDFYGKVIIGKRKSEELFFIIFINRLCFLYFCTHLRKMFLALYVPFLATSLSCA